MAEPAKEYDKDTSTKSQPQQDQLVGVVDVTVLRDNDVLQHLEGAEEYLYVSGIAVSNDFRFFCLQLTDVYYGRSFESF